MVYRTFNSSTYVFFGNRIRFTRVVKALLKPCDIADRWSHKNIVSYVFLDFYGLPSPPSLHYFARFRSRFSQRITSAYRHFWRLGISLLSVTNVNSWKSRTGLEMYRTRISWPRAPKLSEYCRSKLIFERESIALPNQNSLVVIYRENVGYLLDDSYSKKVIYYYIITNLFSKFYPIHLYT